MESVYREEDDADLSTERPPRRFSCEYEECSKSFREDAILILLLYQSYIQLSVPSLDDPSSVGRVGTVPGHTVPYVGK